MPETERHDKFNEAVELFAEAVEEVGTEIDLIEGKVQSLECKPTRWERVKRFFIPSPL